jgi:superfamily II DNA or RNA helicase
MILRPYQVHDVAAIRSAYAAGQRAPLYVAPTGSGKTVLFSHVTQGAVAKGNRIMVLTHRQELVGQISRTFTEIGVDHGYVVSDRPMNQAPLAQIASVQTLVRRLGKIIPPDLIIIDEAHHSNAGSWKAVTSHFKDSKLLGVTATPERLDGKGLSEIFSTLIRGPEVSDLIEQGYLSKPVYFCPPGGADMNGVHAVAGDFNKHEANDVVDKPKIVGCAVDHYRKICPGVPAIAFCISVKHAQHVAEAFSAAGYLSDCIDGTLSDADRRDRVQALATGRLNVLTSCEIVSEGFDLPVAGAAILLRPTQSLALHLQQIGRVLRPAPGKTRAVILDHVGNLMRHGFAEEQRDWSLEGYTKKRRAKEEPVAPLSQCPTCYAIHPPAPVCPNCQHVYEVKSRKIEQVNGELVEVTQATLLRKRAQGQSQTFEQLVALGHARGMSHTQGWARHVLEARQRKQLQSA